ncbi:MAG: hypothetical protein V4547_17955 [Bacteroidota bacterium]
MEKVELNIFGKIINIMPEGQLVTLSKIDDDRVSLVAKNQYGAMSNTPIYCKRDFNKTADEFIREFEYQNYLACKK